MICIYPKISFSKINTRSYNQNHHLLPRSGFSPASAYPSSPSAVASHLLRPSQSSPRSIVAPFHYTLQVLRFSGWQLFIGHHQDMEAISVLSVALPVETKVIHSKAFCNHNISHSRGSTRKIFRDNKRYGGLKIFDNHDDCASITQSLSRKRLPHIANELVVECNPTTLMLYYAENGFFAEADAIRDEIMNSCYNLDLHVVSDLIDAYIRMGLFDEIGELDLMENTLKVMVSKGFLVDSAIGNAYIVYYSRFGSIPMMENAYKRLKSSRILIEKDAISAISSAYIRDKKFHSLGNFLRDVGLGRRNVGNLLWNLLLLSYAANFKMKSLQREFLNMIDAGFYPDLTTFNIRAVAFSKMSLFWDLHLSLEHMNHNGVVADLVTYGCVVDAYLDRRLGRNLDFVLRKMNVKDSARVLTDEIVFEVLGKGEFHSSSEAFLEFKRQKTWSYKALIAMYLKKKYRSNQVFWNY